MRDDIVERLRKGTFRVADMAVTAEAADEIERLRQIVDDYAPQDGRYVVLCDDRSMLATDELMDDDVVLIDRGDA